VFRSLDGSPFPGGPKPPVAEEADTRCEAKIVRVVWACVCHFRGSRGMQNSNSLRMEDKYERIVIVSDSD
jgi:hypothetical protein